MWAFMGKITSRFFSLARRGKLYSAGLTRSYGCDWGLCGVSLRYKCFSCSLVWVMTDVGYAFRSWLRLSSLRAQISCCIWSCAILKILINWRSRCVKLWWVRRWLRHVWGRAFKLGYLDNRLESHIDWDLLNDHLLDRHLIIRNVGRLLPWQTCHVTICISVTVNSFLL